MKCRAVFKINICKLDLIQLANISVAAHNVMSPACQYVLPLHCHSGHMRSDIVLHQKEPRLHCTSIRSDSHSEDFVSLPHSSQDTIGYDTEVCASFKGYASPDHHMTANHHGISRQLSHLLGLNLLSSVKRILVVSGECQVSCVAWAVSTNRIQRCWVLMVRNTHTSSLLKAILQGSRSVPPASSCTKEQNRTILLSC